MNFQFGDYLIVVLYFVIVLFVGFRASKNKGAQKSDDEFLLAGRRLTTPFFVATLVSTWYGNILGVGEFVFSNGVSAWVCFGLPYYVTGIIFALFFAKRIRNFNVSSIPEQIRTKYGATAGIISSIIVLVITIPAAYVLMLGVFIKLFVGWDLWICIIAGAVLSIIYLFKGGFASAVKTNTVQFILMYLGFASLIFFCVVTFGSPLNLISILPKSYFTLTGNNSWQVIAVWFIISLQTFIDPSFHQRCSAAITPNTARNAILISVLFWIIFDSMTLLAGLYARAYFPNISPIDSFTMLGSAVMPYLWKGFFVVSMIAT
ncbi:MAG: hypothetical protein WCL30_06245, partial [Pseudomonadota bacterium]